MPLVLSIYNSVLMLWMATTGVKSMGPGGGASSQGRDANKCLNQTVGRPSQVYCSCIGQAAQGELAKD